MKPFKVGDLVTDIRIGYGMVSKILTNLDFPVRCKFDSAEDRSYTNEGRYMVDDKFPTLIHGHPESISIVAHKTKVK